MKAAYSNCERIRHGGNGLNDVNADARFKWQCAVCRDIKLGSSEHDHNHNLDLNDYRINGS
jgi:hypothetical protein